MLAIVGTAWSTVQEKMGGGRKPTRRPRGGRPVPRGTGIPQWPTPPSRPTAASRPKPASRPRPARGPAPTADAASEAIGSEGIASEGIRSEGFGSEGLSTEGVRGEGVRAEVVRSAPLSTLLRVEEPDAEGTAADAAAGSDPGRAGDLRQAAVAQLASREGLAQAVLLAEVLGKPRALRPYGRG